MDVGNSRKRVASSESEDDLAGGSTGSQNRSRKRVSNACLECRRRKARCDGVTPRCGQCIKISAECMFVQDDKRKIRGKSKLDLVQEAMQEERETTNARIAALESLIRDKLGGAPPAAAPPPPLSAAQPVPQAAAPVPPPFAVAPSPSVGAPLAIDLPVHGDYNPFEYDLSFSSIAPPVSEPSPNAAHRASILVNMSQASMTREDHPEWLAYVEADDEPAEVPAPPFTGSAPVTGSNLLGREDMAALPAGTLETVQQGQKTPWGIIPASLPAQLAGRDGRLSLAEGGQLRFYGATSNRHLSYEGMHLPGNRSELSLDERCRVAMSGAGLDQSNIPADLEDELLRLYFTWHDPVFHVLDRDTFFRHRALYQKDPSTSKFYSLGLLNAMLAYSASLSDDWLKRAGVPLERAGDDFMRRATICVDAEMDSPSEMTAVALAIMAARNAFCGRDSRGWILINSACACAVDLGLHSDVTPWLEAQRISPEHYKVRSIAFWGVFCYAKLWGLYLGRPLPLPTQIDVPHPDEQGHKDDEPWSPLSDGSASRWATSSGNESTPAGLGAGARITGPLVDLLRITDKIAGTLYAPTPILLQTSLPRLRDWVTSVHKELRDWKDGLPQTLVIDFASSHAPEAHVINLQLQYHATVILLHRPFLTDNRPDLRRENTSFHVCLSAATAMAQLIERYQRLYTFQRTSVLVNHTIFTAATIHVYALYVTPEPPEPGKGRASPEHTATRTSARKSLICCLAALSSLAVLQIHARKSYIMIILLMKKWDISLRDGHATDMKTTVEDVHRRLRGNQPPLPSDAQATLGFSNAASQQYEILSKELFAISAVEPVDTQAAAQHQVLTHPQPDVHPQLPTSIDPQNTLSPSSMFLVPPQTDGSSVPADSPGGNLAFLDASLGAPDFNIFAPGDFSSSIDFLGPGLYDSRMFGGGTDFAIDWGPSLQDMF